MRVFIISTLLVLFAISATCKDNSYNGWISVDGKKIKFSVQYKIASNNLITGTSLTAQGTADETKCKIKGKYNRRTGDIYFYETVVISSKAKFENLNFCLLSAKLKRKNTSREFSYSGNFTGYVRGTKKKCAAGKMYIAHKKQAKRIVKNTPTKPVVLEKKEAPKPKTLYSHIKSKKSITYNYTNAKAYLEIWDDIQADGDRVTIYLDGKKILTNYELNTTKKRISLHLTGKHFLKIVAENEGKAAPNTSRISLMLGNTAKEITAHIKTKDFIYLVLEKE